MFSMRVSCRRTTQTFAYTFGVVGIAGLFFKTGMLIHDDRIADRWRMLALNHVEVEEFFLAHAGCGDGFGLCSVRLDERQRLRGGGEGGGTHHCAGQYEQSHCSYFFHNPSLDKS